MHAYSLLVQSWKLKVVDMGVSLYVQVNLLMQVAGMNQIVQFCYTTS